jgi:non-heme chloroperoxidase
VGDGTVLHVQDTATKGPTVLLLPGYGMTHEVFDRQVRVLAAGHRLVTMDPRGHGASDKPFAAYDADRLASDVLEVIAALGLSEVILVGWSLGGLVALRAATTPDAPVARLVLVASNGVSASRAEGFPFGAPADEIEPALLAAEHADRLLARRSGIASAFAAPPQPHLLDWLTQCSLQMPSWAAQACTRTLLRTCSVERLADLRIPVAVIHGDSDPVFSTRAIRWVVEQLDDVRIWQLAQCGHYPMFEAPDDFDAALSAAIGAAPGTKASP